MATTIKLKNGSGAPLAGDLVQGEPAFDLTNKRLYTEDSGGTVIEVGTNPTSLTTGTFTSTGIDDNATSTAITIDSSENVGIGTTSPSTALHVYATSAGDLLTLDTASTPSSPNIVFKNANGEQARINSKNGGSLAIGTGSSGTERVLIDSSGNVGIGNTPVSKLDVEGEVRVNASADHLKLVNSATTARFDIAFEGGSGADALTFTRAGVGERMRIDSGGNVGIGTTSPSSLLDVSSGTNTDGTDVTITVGGTSANTRQSLITKKIQSSDRALEFYAASGSSSEDIRFFRDNTNETMRIDSSGNLLVGGITNDTPGLGDTDVGASFRADGASFVSRTLSDTSGSTFYVNRNTYDGNLIQLQKNGTTVGSIGTAGGQVYLDGASGDIGLFMGTNNLYPRKSAALADNAVDIGQSSYRFKDLYLSGGAYLGGTAAANHLDDYEEGTHNTTISVDGGSATFSQVTLAYTKIGRLVSVAGTFRVNTISSPTGSLTFTLPFTALTGSGELQTGGSIVPNIIANANCNALLPQVGEGDSYCTIFNGTGNNLTDAANTLSANATYRVNLVYYTS